jgi:hypothetical protein
MNKWLLYLVVFFAVERFCHFQTEGFCLSKMMNGSSNSSSPSQMTLTFIGAGKQYYAFETPDGHYVVKFMKFSRRRPLPWLANLPLPSFLDSWRQNYLAERAKRLSHLQRSGKLAFDTLSDETGIVASDFLPPVVTLIDKLGIHHTVSLHQTSFYVQKKAELLPRYFEQHPSEAHSLITSYITTVSSQCSKGVCNLDPIVDRNFGVANHKLIVLDFGSLMAHDKLKSSHGLKKEIFLELLPLRQWLQQHHPEHLFFFDAELKRTVNCATMQS